jgi:hypothetical protein
MANSTFRIKIGSKNGGNGRVIRNLSGGAIRHAWAPRFWWYQLFDVTEAGALDADTSQRFDLHSYNPHNLFPANVERTVSIIRVVRNVAGGAVSACTTVLGDAGDDNGLITATTVFAAGTIGTTICTPAAAEYAPRFESAFIPQIGLDTTTANVAALTGGQLLVCIGFNPPPAI